MAAGAAVGTWQKIARLVQHGCNQQPGTAEAAAALHDANQLLEQQPQQPIPPKAAWKKLVQQLKVPLQLGTAFSTAAQRRDLAAVRTAGAALVALLQAAGDIHDNSLLNGGVRQQLQQAGVLPQLAAVMTAAAADARDEAAALAAAAGAAVDIERFTSRHKPAGTRSQQLLNLVCLHLKLLNLHGCPDSPDPAWLCDPCGHTSAGLQLSFAALQHASSVLQHVLPAVQQRAPQHAAALLNEQQLLAQFAGGLSWTAVGALGSAVPRIQSCSSDEDKLVAVLLSPHVLPCLAAALLVSASNIKAAVLQAGSHRARAGSSSSGGGSSRARQRDSRSRGTTQLQQSAAAAAGVSSEGGSGAPTPCQQQLLGLLGLVPEVAHGEAEHTGDMLPVLLSLPMALQACLHYQTAVINGARDPSVSADEQEERWEFEQQVWLLLPTLLLPCATTLQSARVQDHTAHETAKVCVQQLLRVSRLSMLVCGHLQGSMSPASSALSVAAWEREVLGALLLLAEQQQPITLLPAQAQAAEGAEEAAPASAQSARDNSSGSSSAGAPPFLVPNSGTERAPADAFCAVELLGLLSGVVTSGLTVLPSSQAAGGQPTPVSERWVELAAACEAQLRTATAAVQGGSAIIRQGAGDCAEGVLALLLRDDLTLTSPTPLERRMGLCGPEAFARELRQYYSLLSSVLKRGVCQSVGGQLCWEPAAGTFCLAAAMAAVGLLSKSGVSGGSAAAAQQPAVDYLPSLVIFGRCCLFWAQQLQQQAPELLLLAAGASQQQQLDNIVLHALSAAGVCVPSLRQGADTGPDCSLERMCAVVSGWVADPKSAAAHAQLAAAGCGPQQLQQQLDALLAAQQGTQQQQPEGSLTNTALAALVQQLQATGAMLSSIAVPHFCNHAACGNLSGPTEVGLVSGRVPCGALLWAALPAAGVGAAQAGLQGAAGGGGGSTNSAAWFLMKRRWLLLKCGLVNLTWNWVRCAWPMGQLLAGW